MKKATLLAILIFLPIGIYAQKRIDSKGIYGKEVTIFSVHMTAGPNYYFGDVERGEMFGDGFKNQVNYFGNLAVGCSPVKYINIRLALVGGALSGKSDTYNFSSFFIEPDICFEAHPITIFAKNDPYFFAGIGLNMSKIASDDLNGFNLNTSASVPIAPIGFGYQYNFDNGIHLGFEMAIRMALMDRVDKNLDAYPYSVNGDIIRGRQSQFLDGYYTFGIKFGYTWF